MDKELLKYCRYYKGEDDNPFDSEDRENHLFWYFEQCYWDGDWSSHKVWEADAKEYIERNKDKKNFLTSDAPIEQKAFVRYAEAMLEKWSPQETHLIFNYGK